jgi:LPXTG-motif cell wall-anchored protein
VKTIELSVVKVWMNDDEATRPSEVTVVLYKDGAKYSTVKLNKADNWRYTWTGLSSTAKWQLIEESVPTGYTMTAVQEGSTFIVTNTGTGTPTTETKTPETPTTTTTTTNQKLPQTGQIWWPIPLLAFCGIIAILLGVKIRRKHG